MDQLAAKAFLKTEGKKQWNKLKEEQRTLEAHNEDVSWYSDLGSVLGSVGVPLLAMLTGGPISLAGAALLSGAGSYAGSGLGESVAGGFKGGEELSDFGFFSDTVKDLEFNLDKQEQYFDEGKIASAISSALSSYVLAGGDMPGTKGWKDTEGLKGIFKEGSAFGGLDLSKTADTGMDSILDSFRSAYDYFLDDTDIGMPQDFGKGYVDRIDG